MYTKQSFSFPMRRHSTLPSDQEKDQHRKGVATPLGGDFIKPKGRFRELWDNYGMVFLGTYASVYLMTLGTVYEIVAMKHIDAHSVVAYLHHIGLDNYMDLTPIATSKAGNFALAWILTKFTEPLRLAFTVTITPSFARFLGKAPPKKVVHTIKENKPHPSSSAADPTSTSS
jgi:hypothetical protein